MKTTKCEQLSARIVLRAHAKNVLAARVTHLGVISRQRDGTLTRESEDDLFEVEADRRRRLYDCRILHGDVLLQLQHTLRLI